MNFFSFAAPNLASATPAAAATRRIRHDTAGSHLLEKTLAAAAVVLSLFTVASAEAAPVQYQESVSGDLPQNGALTNFNFEVGANTISGFQQFDARNGVAADFDHFKFVLPAHTQLVGIKLATQMTETIGQLTLPLYLDIFVDALPAVTVSAHEKVNLLDPANPLAGSFSATMPLSAGSYLFYEGQVGSLYAGQAVFWNYTWTFDVAAVPEPGSVTLVGAALLGLAAARRRQRRSSVDVNAM